MHYKSARLNYYVAYNSHSNFTFSASINWKSDSVGLELVYIAFNPDLLRSSRTCVDHNAHASVKLMQDELPFDLFGSRQSIYSDEN